MNKIPISPFSRSRRTTCLSPLSMKSWVICTTHWWSNSSLSTITSSPILTRKLSASSSPSSGSSSTSENHFLSPHYITNVTRMPPHPIGITSFVGAPMKKTPSSGVVFWVAITDIVAIESRYGCSTIERKRFRRPSLSRSSQLSNQSPPKNNSPIRTFCCHI